MSRPAIFTTSLSSSAHAARSSRPARLALAMLAVLPLLGCMTRMPGLPDAAGESPAGNSARPATSATASGDTLAAPDSSGSDPAQAGPSVLSPARLDPRVADADWHIPLPDRDDAGVHAQVERLQNGLAAYLQMQAAGGWPEVPEGPALAAGTRDPRVELLRNRLRASGDYAATMGADPWFFDAGLDAAVRRFQQRHGLAADGAVGERTLEALNVPLDSRIGQLRATLARWQWLPADPGPRYLWVNPASGTLSLVEAGKPVLTMRIIAGHPERPTPSFVSDIRQLVFNPTWYVPRSIAVEDVLPRQQADATFITRQRMRAWAGAPGTGSPVDPEDIDWEALGPDRFPYRLTQDPGAGNSLGRIKFVMDNPYDIYLHDTSSRGLFSLETRLFSSGCIRVEDPLSLADRLLAGDAAWSPDATRAAIDSGRTQSRNLPATIPVYVVYLTAWVSDDGTMNFRRDIYGRDARLLAKMRPVAAQ
jgi:murein L,D-transpeptidase YcbB/YkuD